MTVFPVVGSQENVLFFDLMMSEKYKIRSLSCVILLYTLLRIFRVIWFLTMLVYAFASLLIEIYLLLMQCCRLL